MDKKKTIEVLGAYTDSIWRNNTTREVCLYERICLQDRVMGLRGSGLYVNSRSGVREAVEAVIKHVQKSYGSGEGFGSSVRTPFLPHGLGYYNEYYELDCDIELIVRRERMEGLPTSSGAETINRITLRRRQALFSGKKKLIPVALKIQSTQRKLLPASAGIVDTEGDFVIVIPDASSYIRRSASLIGAPIHIQRNIYIEFQKMVFAFKKYFEERWVKDTILVHRIPEEKQKNQSSNGKISYLHKVLPRNPIAGYAECVLEADVKLVHSECPGTSLAITLHDPNNPIQDNLKQTFQLEGTEKFDMLRDLVENLAIWYLADRYRLLLSNND